MANEPMDPQWEHPQVLSDAPEGDDYDPDWADSTEQPINVWLGAVPTPEPTPDEPVGPSTKSILSEYARSMDTDAAVPLPQFPRGRIMEVPDPMPPREEWREWPPLDLQTPMSRTKLTSDCYPNEGFFPAFVDYMSPYDVAEAHVWGVAVGGLAALLGRWWRLKTIDRGLMSNVYILLLSNSAGGKSLSLDGLETMVPPDILYSNTPRSPNAFVEKLQEIPNLCWAIDEAGQLFQQLPMLHQADLPYYLTQAYDGRSIGYLRGKKRDRSDEVTAVKPCLTLVGVSTVEGLLPAMPVKQVEALFTGGLLSRFMLVPSYRKAPPNPGRRDPILGQQLAEWCGKLLLTRPRTGWHTLTLSPEARMEVRVWDAQRGEHPDTLIRGSWGRARVFALKLAVIYHASIGRGPTEPITADLVVQAIRAVDTVLLPTHYHLAQIATLEGVSEKVKRIREILKQSTYGVWLTDMTALHNLAGMQRDLVLAAINDEIEYSRWTITGEKGPPRTLIAMKGRTPEVLVGMRCTSTKCGAPQGVTRVMKDNETKDPEPEWNGTVVEE